MQTFYTTEKSVQIVVALLKAHGIRKIIASPGTTNITLVASLQCDPFFEMYSAADERSAAYMACGLAVESGEPVVLSCTGATASRNYIPALTEAFYRKIPVLAITSTQNTEKVGHLVPQVIDRSEQLSDIVRYSTNVPAITDDSQIWGCEIKVNNALLELTRHGGGPVHINLATIYCKDFTVEHLPKYRVIRRVNIGDEFPQMDHRKVAIFIGSNYKLQDKECVVMDDFCAQYGGVVLCDHTSGYKGRFGVLSQLLYSQASVDEEVRCVDLLIHIGEVSGEYGLLNVISPKEVWRVSEDGEIRDTFRKLTCVFEMDINSFFEHYVSDAVPVAAGVYEKFASRYDAICKSIPELPFSNIWIARKISKMLPENSVLHLGILNSLRAWNFFEVPKSVNVYSNVGGFGIDGGISTLIGASLADKERLYFGVVGDLAFFYDMNSLGNRHVGKNIRLMLINNGVGTEFKNYSHPAYRFGQDADKYMAAAGHYGNKSPLLVKHYAEDLGFEYLTASNKQEFDALYERFISAEITDRPILFEVFTESGNESDALRIISNVYQNTTKRAANIVREILGESAVQMVKKIIGK